MKHIILILIAILAMFTFWRTTGGSLKAGEHQEQMADFIPPAPPPPADTPPVPLNDEPSLQR